jgi:hypothetical protein
MFCDRQVCELCPLRDEGLEIHQRLKTAGCATVLRHLEGQATLTDILFPADCPEAYRSTLAAVS